MPRAYGWRFWLAAGGLDAISPRRLAYAGWCALTAGMVLFPTLLAIIDHHGLERNPLHGHLAPDHQVAPAHPHGFQDLHVHQETSVPPAPSGERLTAASPEVQVVSATVLLQMIAVLFLGLAFRRSRVGDPLAHWPLPSRWEQQPPVPPPNSILSFR